MNTVTILSYGMGVESSAILTRWILEPETCPCELSDLVVVTAQTGDEFPDTGVLVETYLLPLLRQHHIRFVQLARHGHLEADGITVLDDTHEPHRVYLEGDYKLSDELRNNGTIPQASGVHRCALKFKAWVIEQWLAKNLCASDFKHAIGYNAEETRRIEKSEYAFAAREIREVRMGFGFNVDEKRRIEQANEYDGLRGSASKVADDESHPITRTAIYPLMDWGWTRQHCLDYLQKTFGVEWQKSACTYCPYGCNKQNRSLLVERFRRHPEQTADSLMLEYVSLALNPRSMLYCTKSLYDVVEAGGITDALSLFRARLEASEWAVYRVRRIFNAKQGGDSTSASKGTVQRAVEKLATLPTRSSAERRVRVLGHSLGAEFETVGDITYAHTVRKGEVIRPVKSSTLPRPPWSTPRRVTGFPHSTTSGTPSKQSYHWCRYVPDSP